MEKAEDSINVKIMNWKHWEDSSVFRKNMEICKRGEFRGKGNKFSFRHVQFIMSLGHQI